MNRQIREDERPWIPPQVDLVDPVDGDSEPEDRNVQINTVPGEIEVADESVLQKVIEEHGKTPEPEIGRARFLRGEGEIGTAGYADTYWTHFDFRSDVRKAITRVQKQFPWLTYANTYYHHPPVYGRTYEFVSVDYWAGGLVNGRYVGYRGKPIWSVVDGWKVFNAAFNDPYLPNIAWIIYGGYMWSRNYGWGPAPWGPADSDPRHDHHIHITSLI